MTRCTPELRTPNDPEIGECAPVKTQILYQIRVGQSELGLSVGKGVFAEENIPEGAVIAIGGGQVFSDYSRIPPDKDYACVFNEGVYIAPIDFTNPTPNWFINHSCDSNVKVIGRLILLARRKISSGEELTVDYSTMAAGEPDYKMLCLCGSPNCRKVVTGNDWNDRVLFDRFYEEWPSFIQRLK